MASADEEEDIDLDEDVSARLQAGIDAGNIHIDKAADERDDDRMIHVLSAEAEAAQAKHAALLQSMEEKRVKQNLRVPTDDKEVKQRLRALKEPICYFGEDVCVSSLPRSQLMMCLPKGSGPA